MLNDKSENRNSENRKNREIGFTVCVASRFHGFMESRKTGSRRGRRRRRRRRPRPR
jgi:hypothetical protein